MTRTKVNSKLKQRNRGGALTVEMAMTLPIFFTILFGCYEICHASMLQHAAESAAYEGARAGIVPGASETRCRNSATLVLRSMGIRKFDVRVSPSNIGTATPAVEVEVRVPMKGNTTFATFFFKDPVFRGRCELVRETL
jgi:Flp pilus assembly protein TadG